MVFLHSGIAVHWLDVMSSADPESRLYVSEDAMKAAGFISFDKVTTDVFFNIWK